MTRLNDLYDFADNRNINIYSFELPISKSLSLMDNKGSCHIAIDFLSLTSSADESVHLAHEIGHCETGGFYTKYSPNEVIAKAENRADKWAIKKLIPKDELDNAFINGITEIWELAEHFNVTEDFIKKAVYYYKNN